MEALEVLNHGLLASLQDGGRPGWRRFGVPPGGAMDRRAWRQANRLLDNPPEAAVVECLQGTRLLVLESVELAAAGAWGARAWRAQAGEIVDFPASLAGVWHYLALPGGLASARFLASASVCARAGIGVALARGDRLACQGTPLGRLPAGVKARQPSEAPDYGDAPLGLWPGPQWDAFDAASRAALIDRPWRVSARSDRTGYRLEGPALTPPPGNLASEPVRVGSIQVPPGGQPLVTLQDGPTVGGYAKIALIDASDLDRLVQTRPGQSLTFRMMR
jgi:biotin-dependent carboxylase-like uncharacterized protein